MKKCPLIKKACWGDECMFWTRLLGNHPQTGAAVEEWGCAIAFLPVLLIENAKETRGNAAAVESFRNEMSDAATQFRHLAVASARARDNRLNVQPAETFTG